MRSFLQAKQWLFVAVQHTFTERYSFSMFLWQAVACRYTHPSTTQTKKTALQVSWIVTIWHSLVCQSMCCKQSTSLTVSIISRIKTAVLCIEPVIVICWRLVYNDWFNAGGVGMYCFESTFLMRVTPRAAHMPGQAMSLSASSASVLMCTMNGFNDTLCYILLGVCVQ